MVCDDVRRVAYFYLDGQLSENKGRDFSNHLRLCPNCGERILIHRRLRVFIRQRLGYSPAPAELRNKLAQTLPRRPQAGQ